MQISWLVLAQIRRSLSVMSLVVAFAACGDDDARGEDAGRIDSGAPRDDGGSSDAGGGADTGTTDAGSTVDAGEVTESPMGMDCTDACPSFEGRDYVCTFLPGFPTTLGYCSLECTTGDPTACVDTEPGEVYCNSDVGRCVIGCPFSGCPNDMECTFHFNDEPACEPTP
jgi:hypothetical protein